MSKKWLLFCLSTCFFDKINCCNENTTVTSLSSSPNLVAHLEEYMEKQVENKKRITLCLPTDLVSRNRSTSLEQGDYSLGISLGSPIFQDYSKPKLTRDCSTQSTSSIKSFESQDSISGEILYSPAKCKRECSHVQFSPSPIQDCHTPSPSPFRTGDEDKDNYKIKAIRSVSESSLLSVIVLKSSKN